MMAAGGDESKLQARTVEEHEKWSRVREQSWSRLDEPERLAWQAFWRIDGQFLHRETFYEGKGKTQEPHNSAVLDGSFADIVCREWLGVPDWQMPRVWSGIQVLHDAHRQRGREYASLCVHMDDPLSFIGSAARPGGRLQCPRCAIRWRCRVCWVEGVWHDHGS